MVRKCLDCPRLIASGSRCADCARARRPAGARHQLPQMVKARDGHRCTMLGCATPYDRVQAHHLLPIALGGAHRAENMTTYCHRHHSEAHRLGRVETR
jgi:hypothetical protein